jgi:hypothetical protein
MTATIDIAAVDSFAYTYDANKNKTAETRSGVMQPYGYTATYDDEDRLATWTRGDSNLTQSWNLSLVGNWSQFTENGATESRTHDAAHQLVAIDTSTLAHDARGNLTRNVLGCQYTWAFGNKLASATVPSGAPGTEGTHTYSYDALGRRVGGPLGGSHSAAVYMHNGHQAICEYEAGVPSATARQKSVFGSFIDEPVIVDDSQGIRYYHSDGLYSTAVLTNATGQPTERWSRRAKGASHQRWRV